jgi:hypothetical protein
MKVWQNIFFPALLVMLVLTGCASMTPRYQFSDEINGITEENSALIQIPTATSLSALDDIEASFSVEHWFNSQGVVQHHYRETLIPQGLHTIMYRNNKNYKYYSEIHRSSVTASQIEPFLTAIEFKKGYTYRIQTVAHFENGKVVFYGWVEELPFFMERRKIKPGLNFHGQFEYWYAQDWKVVGVGLPAKEFVKLNTLELQAASIVRISELKTKFPRLK